MSARIVRALTEEIHRTLPWVETFGIEEDHNEAPGGTTDYPGRALAFLFKKDGLTFRVLVEDVTVDEER